jgi:capsular polysaccharide biosynthesis protein
MAVEVMAVLQTYNSEPLSISEDHGQGQGFRHYVGIVKRRLFHFLIPFALIATVAFLITAIQRPIYLAEGKILVESREIPADLVRPTVTTASDERIQVIQQRIMTREFLLTLVSKFGLFAAQRLSATEVFGLMRERTTIKRVDIDSSTRRDPFTIAFTVSFEYESAELALRVANEIFTQILDEDTRSRTNRAKATTSFLAKEVERLQGELESVEVRISEIKRRPSDSALEIPQQDPQQEKSQLAALNALRAELIQKTSVYSDAHPAVTAIKKRIAAMEKIIKQSAQSPSATQATLMSNEIEGLVRQRQAVERRLDDANGKLAAARLGESLEIDQQSERLQIIERPTKPQKPIRPNRRKTLGIALLLAAMVGVGTVLVAEALDKSIREPHDLLGVVDSHLIVSIPYISTRGEILRRKLTVVLGVGIVVMVLLGGLAGVVILGPTVNFSWFDGSWLDPLTRLSK